VFRLFSTAEGKTDGVGVVSSLTHNGRINKKLRANRQELGSKRQEFRRIKDELLAERQHEQKIELKKKKKKAQQEIYRLEKELAGLEEEHNAAARRKTRQAPAKDSQTGALPDFVVVGAKKSGTTSLYHLLVGHPYVQPAAKKELHYFDNLVEDEDTEWYRHCFPAPKWKEGRRTITGEATPYLANPLAPERMAQVIPQAQLIALLRNPVDRAYSDYQQVVRKGRETRTFDETVEAALEEAKQHPLDRRYAYPYEAYSDSVDVCSQSGCLLKGLYVDQLQHWAKFFDREQMLVLQSESFFAGMPETLEPVLNFLGLPDWEPEATKVRNKGTYEQGMDPATRQRLEEFFEPHNQRLYEYLGVDFEWENSYIERNTLKVRRTF
jgi:Sulfotransferase domain